MEEQLYEMVWKVFCSDNNNDLQIQPEKLVDECIPVAGAICMTILNMYLKRKTNIKNIKKSKLMPSMYLANLWGLQIYLKQLALGKQYISPTIYNDKDNIERARKAAIYSLTKEANIDREAEAVMDRFTEQMAPALKKTGVNISKELYIKLLETNLRWGYEFAREVCKV